MNKQIVLNVILHLDIGIEQALLHPSQSANDIEYI